MKAKCSSLTKIVVFGLVAIIVIGILPLINGVYFKTTETWKLWEEEFIDQSFILDNIVGAKNSYLFDYSLSGDIDKVLVGQSDYLYLGNNQRDLSLKFSGGYSFDAGYVKNAAQELKIKEDLLSLRDIGFLYVIIPEKQAIYPAFLPRWFTFRDNHTRKELVAEFRQQGLSFVDLTPILANTSEPTYYKSDTHWNNLGAWLGYQTVMQELPQFTAISDISPKPFSSEHQGDLYGLLKISKVIKETDYYIDSPRVQSLIKQCEFDNDHYQIDKASCGTSSNDKTHINNKSVVTYNKNALNDKKIIWVRDSFGDAQSPLFQATFTEVYQIHHRFMNGEHLLEFVDKIMPDYVIIQVIERDQLVRY